MSTASDSADTHHVSKNEAQLLRTSVASPSALTNSTVEERNVSQKVLADTAEIKNKNANKRVGIVPDVSVEEKLLQDPVAFWSTWSERKAYCLRLEHRTADGKQSTGACNCFEGLGSVM